MAGFTFETVIELIGKDSNFSKTLTKVEGSLNSLSKTVSKVNSQIADVTGKMGDSFKKAGTIVTGATVAIGAASSKLGWELSKVSAELDALDAQFDQTFKGQEQAKAMEAMTEQVKSQGIHLDRLKRGYASFASTFKGGGADSKQTLDLTRKYMTLAGDAAAYYDMSLEDVSQRMKSLIMGNFTAGDAIGVNINAAKMSAKALEKYGKKWQELDDTLKASLLAETIQSIYDASGATGQAAREMDNLENVTQNLGATWKRFQDIVGKPILEKVVGFLQKLSLKLEDLSAYIKSLNWSNLSAFWEELGNGEGFLDVIFSKIKQLIAFLASLDKKTLTTGLNFAKMGALAGPGLLLVGNGLKFISSILSGGLLGKLLTLGALSLAPSIEMGSFDESLALVGYYFDDLKERFKGLGRLLGDVFGTESLTSADVIYGVYWGIAEAIKWISQALIDMKPYLESFKEQLARIDWSKVWEGIKNVADMVWNTLLEAFLVMSGIIVGLIDTFASFHPFLQKTIGFFVLFAGPIVKVINFLNIFGGCITSVVKAITWLMGSLGGIAVILAALYLFDEDFRNFINGLLATIWEFFKNVGIAVWDGIKGVGTTLDQWFNDVLGLFTGWISQAWDKAKEIGHNITSGITDGIKNGWNNLKSSVENVCDGVLNRVRGVFQIHSPSRAMADLFGYVMEGAALGVSNSQSLMKAVSDQLGNASTLFGNFNPDVSGGLSASIAHTITGTYDVTKQPAVIHLSLGGSNWRGFVEDIGDELGAIVSLSTY